MRHRLKYLIPLTIVSVGAYFISRANYLVFHGMAETFSISVAVCIFIISWNARRTTGGFFTVLGFSYLSYAVIILFHLLAYRGMSVFPSAIGANMATQLWIAATALHAASIPAAFLALRRKVNIPVLTTLYASAVGLLLAAIFMWDIFPDCFIEGKGLTPFKIASEYVIAGVYAWSIYLLYKSRSYFDQTVFTRILLSLYLAIATEMMFTLYTDPYGVTNFAGHLLRILSSFMAHRALVESSFLNPYAVLFGELRRSEENLQRQKDFVTTVMDTAAGFIAVVDATGRVELSNASCLQLAGKREGELYRAPFAEIFGGADAPAFEDVWRALVSGGTFRFETWSSTSTGEILTSWVARPLVSADGSVSFIILVGTDLSERKSLEVELARKRDEAMEASRLKSVFLATMSHEIRTPMNGIIGMTDLLLDTDLEPRQKEMAGVVRDSANALLGILNDILDFSKIEANKMDIESLDFALLPVVEGVAELLSARAREKGIGLVTYVDPAIPHRVKGDPGRLRQVIMNLAGNAVKFTNAGEVFISAVRAAGERDDVLIRFEVRDTGIGMSEEGVRRIFQPFVQLDSSPCRTTQGTGLGLAISRRLVELMGGTMDVVSEEGKGSVFGFDLPFTIVSSEGDSLPPAFDGLSVLVVTDSPALGSSVSAYLTSWGISLSSLKRIEWREMGYPTGGYDVVIVENADEVIDTQDLPEESRVIEIIEGFSADVSRVHIRLGKPFRQSHLFDALSRLLGMSAHYFPMEKKAQMMQQSPSRRQSGVLILVAEDNPVNQQVALLQLNKLGYSAHAVSTGEEVIQSLQDARYDLVLMDCQMPIMDGYEATKLIRLLEQGTGRHIPILAMTANAMGSDRDECLAAGMDDYISKPVQPEELRRLLEKYLPGGPDVVAIKQFADPTAALNMAYLQDVFGDDEGGMEEILAVFLASSHALIEAAEAALAAADRDALVRVTHQLKGASATIGADDLARIAADLEQKARAGELAEVDRTFPELVDSFAALRAAISIVIQQD